MSERIATINTNEGELNLLFRELLEGCRDDLAEATQNVNMFFDAIQDKKTSGGIEMYAQYYNDALKIKGSARDKQLKLLNMFKDRVSTKEKINLNKREESVGGLPDIAEMTRAIEEMQRVNKNSEKIVLNDETEYSKSLLEQELEEENNSYNDYEDFNDDDLIEDEDE